ncbi:MAG: hypothetical protein RLZZ244_740 [Verrucomicrobiota bacterium]|jgi:RND family efflux transporter MFP subunit
MPKPFLPFHRNALLLIGLILSAPLLGSAADSFTGFSEPVEQIDVAVAETGVIGEIRVKEGDPVQKGDILGRLDIRVLEASLAIAEQRASSESALRSAQARHDLRQTRLRKLQELAASQNANKEELQRAQADFEVSANELQAARDERRVNLLEVERIRQTIEVRTFRSPIGGIVTRVLRDVAENVDARTNHLFTVVNLNQLRILLYVPPLLAKKFHEGSMVPIQPTGESRHGTAQVEFVSPVTDPASGTVRIKLLIDNANRQWSSGTRFEVSLPE